MAEEGLPRAEDDFAVVSLVVGDAGFSLRKSLADGKEPAEDRRAGLAPPRPDADPIGARAVVKAGLPPGPARRAARIIMAMRDGLSNNSPISIETSVLSPSTDDTLRRLA